MPNMDDLDLGVDLALEDIDFTLEADDKLDDIEDDKEEDKKTDEKVDEASLAAAALLDLASPEEISAMAESWEDQRDISETMGVAMEKTIVRIDRKGRLSHLTKQAELNLARQNNDPNYKKLMKIWMLERALEKKIHQKWNSKAMKVAKVKIKDYAANGKRIAKPNPSTVAFKGKVSGHVAQRAVNSAKKMFGDNKGLNPRK